MRKKNPTKHRQKKTHRPSKVSEKSSFIYYPGSLPVEWKSSHAQTTRNNFIFEYFCKDGNWNKGLFQILCKTFLQFRDTQNTRDYVSSYNSYRTHNTEKWNLSIILLVSWKCARIINVLIITLFVLVLNSFSHRYNALLSIFHCRQSILVSKLFATFLSSVLWDVLCMLYLSCVEAKRSARSLFTPWVSEQVSNLTNFSFSSSFFSFLVWKKKKKWKTLLFFWGREN